MVRYWRGSRAWLPWLLAGLAEVAVVTPWLLLFYAAADTPGWFAAVPSLWLPLAVFLAAVLWQSGQRREAPRMRVLGLLGGTALGYLGAYALMPGQLRAGLLALNPALAFVPTAAYLWYRGARHALDGLDYGPVSDRAALSLGAQFAGIFLMLLLGKGQERPVFLLLFWSVVLFFAAGLTLLAILRERSLPGDDRYGSRAGAAASPAVTGFVLGLVALTVVVSSLLTVDHLALAMRAAARVLGPLYSLVVAVVLLVVKGVGMLIAPLVGYLQRVAATRAPALQGGGEAAEPTVPDVPTEHGPGYDLGPLLQAVLVLAAVVVLAAWLYRLTAVRRRGREVDEERVSLGFWASLRQDLLALLRRRGTVRAGEGTPPEEPVPPGSPRALFRRLQRWGARRGRPRGPAETPSAYQAALAAVEPAASVAGAVVTAVYNQARYGPAPPDPAAVAEAARLLNECCEGDSTRAGA